MHRAGGRTDHCFRLRVKSQYKRAGGKVCVKDRKIAGAPARFPTKTSARPLHCELAFKGWVMCSQFWGIRQKLALLILCKLMPHSDKYATLCYARYASLKPHAWIKCESALRGYGDILFVLFVYFINVYLILSFYLIYHRPISREINVELFSNSILQVLRFLRWYVKVCKTGLNEPVMTNPLLVSSLLVSSIK